MCMQFTTVVVSLSALHCGFPGAGYGATFGAGSGFDIFFGSSGINGSGSSYITVGGRVRNRLAFFST